MGDLTIVIGCSTWDWLLAELARLEVVRASRWILWEPRDSSCPLGWLRNRPERSGSDISQHRLQTHFEPGLDAGLFCRINLGRKKHSGARNLPQTHWIGCAEGSRAWFDGGKQLHSCVLDFNCANCLGFHEILTQQKVEFSKLKP